MKKLVRDRIPEIIRADGKDSRITKVQDTAEYHTALMGKLREEVEEFIDSQDKVEIADILEVIDAICVLQGFSKEEIAMLKQKKWDERGGFTHGYILEI